MRRVAGTTTRKEPVAHAGTPLQTSKSMMPLPAPAAARFTQWRLAVRQRSAWALFLVLSLDGCASYSVRQSSVVPLPTAPPPAPLSGRGALELGTSIATDLSPPDIATSESGLASARVQPDGALSVRLADFLLLRAFAAFALPQGSEQVTGTIPAPEETAWVGGIGPVFRLLGAERLVFADFGVTGGFAVIPSRLLITERNFCEAEDPSCLPETTSTVLYRDVMPIFTVRADFGARPAEWISLRVGATVRNQPTNEAMFVSGGVAGSSVSPGPIGIVLHAGVQIDFIDELGMRIDLQWPAANLGLSYGPILSLAIQGRLGGPSRDAPIGLSI